MNVTSYKNQIKVKAYILKHSVLINTFRIKLYRLIIIITIISVLNLKDFSKCRFGCPYESFPSARCALRYVLFVGIVVY
jgi:hypothetical protein